MGQPHSKKDNRFATRVVLVSFLYEHSYLADTVIWCLLFRQLAGIV